ncbi:hypothetical protein FAS51_18475, partial [Klebsiella pneumoniae subsp. pneumoniae]
MATKLAKPLAAPNRLKPPEIYSISFSVNSFIAIPCSDYFPKGQEPRRKVASQDRAARVMPDAYWLNFSSFFDMKDSGKATGEG